MAHKSERPDSMKALTAASPMLSVMAPTLMGYWDLVVTGVIRFVVDTSFDVEKTKFSFGKIFLAACQLLLLLLLYPHSFIFAEELFKELSEKVTTMQKTDKETEAKEKVAEIMDIFKEASEQHRRERGLASEKEKCKTSSQERAYGLTELEQTRHQTDIGDLTLNALDRCERFLEKMEAANRVEYHEPDLSYMEPSDHSYRDGDPAPSIDLSEAPGMIGAVVQAVESVFDYLAEPLAQSVSNAVLYLSVTGYALQDAGKSVWRRIEARYRQGHTELERELIDVEAGVGIPDFRRNEHEQEGQQKEHSPGSFSKEHESGEPKSTVDPSTTVHVSQISETDPVEMDIESDSDIDLTGSGETRLEDIEMDFCPCEERDLEEQLVTPVETTIEDSEVESRASDVESHADYNLGAQTGAVPKRRIQTSSSHTERVKKMDIFNKMQENGPILSTSFQSQVKEVTDSLFAGCDLSQETKESVTAAIENIT